MSNHLLKALLVLGSLLSAKPQAAPVSVKLRVLLVDKDLNQKAVPFYIVSFRNATGEATIELNTDLEGKAEKQLPPGKYSITTAKPMELGGKRYTWNLEVQISGAEQHIDLTNDNAKTEDIPTSPDSSGDTKSSSSTGVDLSAEEKVILHPHVLRFDVGDHFPGVRTKTKPGHDGVDQHQEHVFRLRRALSFWHNSPSSNSP